MDAQARLRVLAEIGRHVPYQLYVWLLTDPASSVGAAPLADIPPPLVARLPELIRLKYLTPVNRWTTVDTWPVFLYRATGGDLAGSLLWRDLLRHYSIVDVATLVFRDRFGCWGFLDLWRTTEPFDDRDERRLAEHVAPVTAAIRRSLAATFTARPVPTASGPAVLMLSPELVVIGQTPSTEDYLRTLVPPGPGQEPVPAGAYNVAAQLLAVVAGVDSNPPTARVHLDHGRWLHLRAAPLHPGGHAAAGTIAVTIEDAAPAQRLDLFARCCGLTPRETQLLEQLSAGVDTRQAARAMAVTGNTVQDHLKSIFAKTGTRTRRELFARALGT